MAQHHPCNTPSSNSYGTAAPTTRPAAILMAQRHPCDAYQQSRGIAPQHDTRATRPTSIVAVHHCVYGTACDAACVSSSKLTSTNLRTSCACYDFATPNARPHTRFVTGPRKPAILATAYDSLRPRKSTVQCLSERINASELPHLPRETQIAARKIMRATRLESNSRAPPARVTFGDQNCHPNLLRQAARPLLLSFVQVAKN